MTTFNDLTLHIGCHYTSFTPIPEFYDTLCPRNLLGDQGVAILLIGSLAMREHTLQLIS